MTKKPHQNAVIFLSVGSPVFARIKDKRGNISAESRREFVKIQLLDDLYLNFKDRRHAFLEQCRCHIPDLNQDATSLNHAYTLISTHFEVGRRAKGGNVFNKLYYAERSGDYLSLGKLRISILASVLPTAASPESKQGNADLTAIAHILTGVLFDEALFVKLVHQTVDLCVQRERSTRAFGLRREAGMFFPFYKYLFGRFRTSLQSMNIDLLKDRWGGKPDQFIAGCWSGYYLNEVNWLVASENGFSKMIVDAAYDKDKGEAMSKLNNWSSTQG